MSHDSPSRQTPSIGGVLWSRLIWRHWRREPALTATLAGILALGVAVFLAVRLANKAAVSGFGLFTESISGESDLLLRPGSGTLDAAILGDLRQLSAELPVDYFPVLELSGAKEGEEETDLLRFVSVDLVAIGNAIGQSGEASGAPVISPDESEPSPLGATDACFVGEAFARARGVEKGSRLRVWIQDRSADLRIAGILPDPANRPAIPENLLLMDLPALQQASGEARRISRIEIRFPGEGSSQTEVTRRLAELSQSRGLILETPEDRKASVTRMSAAFRLNLTILSGLALLVGIYLIFQALEAAVTKRRSEIAILRSLGVTPDQIRRTWLTEAAALGLAGGVLGILLGRLLAEGLVGGIAATVNTLYYETTTSAVALHPGEAAFSLLFGIVASLVAGWIPAREASLTPPSQAMRQGAQGGGLVWLRRWPLGVILLVFAFFVTRFPALTFSGGTIFPLGGYLAALLAVLGGSVLLGALFRPLSRLIGWGRGDAMRRYAASRLAAVGGRHRLTAAGLSVAIGMSAAMAILVASFEKTLTSWIEQLLKADLYIAAPGAASVANGNTISEVDWRGLLELPGIDGADTLQRQSVTYEGRDLLIGGTTYHDNPTRHLQLLWIDAPEKTDPASLDDGGAWVSEPFARRFHKAVGDVVILPTPAGTKEVKVEGIYADYGNEAGTVLVARRFTGEWFGDGSVSNLAIYTSPGADPEVVLERVRERFPALVARTNQRLREESIRIFHQTFAVTYALEAIAVIIAVAGLGLALAGLLLERRNELSTLRAIGATRRDIACAAMWEGLGIALAGLCGGLAVSFFLGWILIGVINPQSFGWTLRYAVPWGTFAFLIGITLATSALVAWAVGFRNANLKSDREE
jgi:putative ABC transport system permease protein